MKHLLIITTLTTAIMLPVGAGFAAGTDQIYGSQLMTNQERLEYRKKITSANTAEERERIRSEHHAMMKERAKERNITLPDEPSAGGAGMSDGMHRGGGMGQGGGMGSGGRDY